MRAAILRRMPIVLVLLGLLVGFPVVSVSLAPAEPLPCGAAAMGAADVDRHDSRGAPRDPTNAPEPGLPGCPASAIGCVAVALPSAGLPVPFAPWAPAWGAGPPSLGAGRAIEPDLFPPILPA